MTSLVVPSFDTEAFARSVRDWLIPNLDAYVVEAAAAHAADDAAEAIEVELVSPRPEDYELGGTGVITRWPSIEISAPDYSVGTYALGQVDADVSVTLVVLIWDRHARHDILYRKMNRLSGAVLACLSAPGAFADATIVGARGSIRFNPETREKDEILSGALLVFQIATTLAR